ncbi:MAG: UvrD-helicase domain-containing protein [Mediterranea sp.]|jgi:ATP-dependent exoDNAse (exonuclease V) beta subunit|nr:UvrD-helicase domain-containing protein [Mediterranea sp.]
MSELLVYKASAGSGKTFTLAAEYIKLLIADPHAYRQILAVTFTNKATAEMKERILGQLYGIYAGDKDSDAYLRRVCDDTGRSENEVRQAAGTALRHMLHDYSRFRVETIDSFFQSVMRNLARELELSPNLNIELNNAEVINDAVDQMIEELDANSPTLLWLLDYIDERIQGDKRWNVSDEVKKFGMNIFDEEYIARGKALRQKLRQPDNVRAYRKQLRALEAEVLDEMGDFARQFTETLANHELIPADLNRGDKGIAAYFRKLAEGKLTDDISNASVEKCLADAGAWTTKSAPRRADIIALAEERLMPLLRRAEESRPHDNMLLNSCRLSIQHLNNLQLLADIDEEVRQLNSENNRFLLSDTNALLHQLVGDGDSSFVFEKLGANIRHVMIDEFQDTGRMQWSNFKLLLLEGLSQGADSLIVGDVKQSIYRWRNADWSILNALDTRLDRFPIRVKTLAINRRSETNVIRFNNRVFTAATRYLNDIYRQQLGHDCDDLLKAYADVEQQSPRTEEKGYVKVSFLASDEEANYAERTLVALGQEVERLVSTGVRLSDIAILVRKNKSIPRIAEYFDNHLGYKIVSDEAFRLDASLATHALVDALRCLSAPADRIAVATLTKESGGQLPPEFLRRREELRLMPLYELLEELYVIFSIDRVDGQDAYLFAFFDAVTDYLSNHPSDIDSFVRHWDETLSSKTIPGGEVADGIRIFSIHKSKGLEFHTVLIPFCDWKMENETNDQLVWCAPSVAPFDALDILPITYSSRMAQSIYNNDYLRERLQLWVDNLNLLYVAFTRAGKNLIVWGKLQAKGTMSELLAAALHGIDNVDRVDGQDPAETEPDEAADYEVGLPCPSAAPQPQTSTTNKLVWRPARRPVRMCSSRRDVEFRQSNRSADFIQGIDEEESDSRFINRGRLLHTLFSTILTTDDIDPAIARLVAEGVMNPDQVEEVRQLTRKAFLTPEVSDWYSGRWQLFNECSIIYKENGALQTRRPDRVMMADGEVVVVDFKFGKENPKYNRQVSDYMRLLARMGYTNISGYIWYVDEERVEAIPYTP